MSDPAHLFQSLRLDDMPVTRSQAHVPQQRGGRNPRSNRGRGRGRGRAQAPPTRVVPVRIFTGRQYYTQVHVLRATVPQIVPFTQLHV